MLHYTNRHTYSLITFKSLKRQMFDVSISIINWNMEVSESFDITIETTEVGNIFKHKTFFHNMPSVGCL